MFNKNAYNILPQGSQLHHHFHTGGDEIFFHHHHEDDDILSGHYFSSSSSAAVNAPAVDAAAFYSIHHQEAAIDPCPKTTKKDRHSKIYTSQGPRDRRVRLSIGVARRFFDLQETLGFDKPSKTLDWLLTNSKTAIKDLMQQQQQQQTKESENVSSPSSECEAKRKLGGDRKCADLVKESRVKARARARERTREKMCIKQLHHNNNNNDDFNSSSSNNIPVDQFCRITTNNNHSHINFHSHPAYEEAPRRNDQDLIQIKTKVKHFMSTSNYGAPSPNYITPTENWDICAILDSHKFINSTSDN